MIDNVTAYPLCWPVGRPRTPAAARLDAAFGEVSRSRTSDGGQYTRFVQLSVAGSLDRLMPELERLGASDVIVSTNVPTTSDDLPYAHGRARGGDPGVAVYFRTARGQPHCISCDKWRTVADNLAAIASHVRAVRGMLRWGAADVATAFAGFRMIDARPPWWRVLGLGAPTMDEATIRETFRALAQQHHPDKGGTHARMAEISAARDEGIAWAQEIKRNGAAP